MSLESFTNYISKIVSLSAEEMEVIVANTTERKYLKGQYILQAGDVNNKVAFILQGCIKTFYIDEDGNEHIVAFGIEDWWTGDLGSLMAQKPADYNSQCLENSVVAIIPYKKVQELYDEIPMFERLFRIITEKAFVASQRRIIESFSLTAKEKYLQFRTRYPKIDQRVPQYMIASYLGFTPEFLSKVRSQIIAEQ